MKQLLKISIGALLCSNTIGPGWSQVDDCPHHDENMDLMRESEKLLPKDDGMSVQRGRLSPSFAEVGHYASDAPTPPVRDIDYLTAPIYDMKAFRSAEKEADDLDRRGQHSLARRIRDRLTNECAQQIGVKVSPGKLICVSTAAQLRDRAWVLERNEKYEMAEKLYQRVLQIYQDEIGSYRKIANAQADLARLYDVSGNTVKAKEMYQKALSTYDSQPKLVDSEAASFFEAYADFLSRQGAKQASQALYKRAALAHKTGSSRVLFW